MLLAACQHEPGGIPEVTPAMAARMEISVSSLESGRVTYMANCNRCHERILPGNEDPEFWREIIPHMAENARLTKAQESDLLLYLMAAHLEARGVKIPD